MLAVARVFRDPDSSFAETVDMAPPSTKAEPAQGLMIPAFCAPGGIRTPNNGSEDRCDIHFTTGANLS